MGVSWSVPAYLFHPLFVHFPIALLVLGFGVGLCSMNRRAPAWFGPAAPATLAAGTLFLWVVLGLGLLAERTAPHVPLAWQVMLAHKRAAFATTAVFTAVTAASLFTGGRHRGWVLAGWALGLVCLVLTAHFGATLVYTYGVGSPPS